jgi:hypothetical protein
VLSEAAFQIIGQADVELLTGGGPEHVYPIWLLVGHPSFSKWDIRKRGSAPKCLPVGSDYSKKSQAVANLVAGVGFEPTIPQSRDYEPAEEVSKN